MQNALWHVVLISFKRIATPLLRQQIYDRYQTLAEDCGGKSSGILYCEANTLQLSWGVSAKEGFREPLVL